MRTLTAFLIFCGLLAPALATAADSAQHEHQVSAAKLLEQASQAVRLETYRGIIVYLRGSSTDTLKVLHRYHNHQQQERLVSLSGPEREVIRKGSKVTSILPGRKLVLMSERANSGLLGNISHFSAKQLKSDYHIEDKGMSRTAGRDARVLYIRPDDKFRYGYRMVIDVKTHLPLQLDLLEGGDKLEQMMFSSISFPKSIPDSQFLPTYDVSGFRIVRHQSVQIDKGKQHSDPEQAWHATDLPHGFKLAESGIRQITPKASVRQLLFTDGVAAVSVFIAPVGLRAPLKGATSMGAVNAYGRIVDKTQITVVGEVPAVTARRIAEHMTRNGKSTSSASGSSENHSGKSAD